MPKALHTKLKREAKKKFPSTSKEAETKQNKYVYGTLNKLKIKKKHSS